jgi:hypothetical protein
MMKLSLVALFVMTMATLTLAASSLPPAPRIAGSEVSALVAAN